MTELGVEIDVCPSCHGVWLEAGKLEALVASSEFFEGDFEVNQSELACAHCSEEKLVTIEMPWGTFARCPACGGIFIDGETLDEITDEESTGNEAIDAVAGSAYGLGALLEIIRLIGPH